MRTTYPFVNKGLGSKFLVGYLDLTKPREHNGQNVVVAMTNMETIVCM